MRTNRNRIVFQRDVVLRFPVQEADKALIDTHAVKQQQAHAAGLPVPEVLDVVAGGDEPHIVMRRVPGTPLMETPLTPDAQSVLARDLAAFLDALWEVQEWTQPQVAWPVLWAVLERIAPGTLTGQAALTASEAPMRATHGDLSPGNLIVLTDGTLTGVIDWDAAVVSDPAMDFSALCANTPASVAARLRDLVPDAHALDQRAQAYLDTWPLQHQLWLEDQHPWLLGDRPLTEPRI